ncbi:DUF192 domain-containing protein [Candidatus Micrarchaeota archaeon]|nr:DUF192 domain-containing protein [Candidatus Micrarchaeota archaeon]
MIIKIDEKATTTFSRARGLMFRKNPKRILFIFNKEGTYPIHSLFVFFKFDAVYLDKNMKIIEIFEGINPFTLIIKPQKKAKYLLEMEVESVKKLKLHKNIVIKTK